MDVRGALVWGAWFLATLLVLYFGSLLAMWLREQVRVLRARLSAEQNAVLDAVLRRVVLAAEQMKKNHGWTNEQVLQYALDMAARYLGEYGIAMPVDAVEAGIEAHVQAMNAER